MDSSVQNSIVKRIRDVCEGVVSSKIEAVALKGVQLLKVHKGFVLCSFIVQNTVAALDEKDENGNWDVGAIATLIDVIGSYAVYSVVPRFSASLDFTISFYSTIKVQEEVEIEAKVMGKKEKLTSVVVEIRKKENREIIALGKQWMSATNIVRSSLNQSSKL